MANRLIRLLSGKIPLGYALYKILNKKRKSLLFFKMYKRFFERVRNHYSDDVFELTIKTDDGFNQVTHPDIAFFRDNNILVLTPYPYCDERLENPCIYFYDPSNRTTKPIKRGALFEPKKERYRHHFSDPAICVDGEKILLFFRDSIHKENLPRRDIIYVTESKDLLTWTTPSVVKNTPSSMISPSFIKIGDDIFVYFVTEKDNKSVLVKCLYKDYCFESFEQVFFEKKNENMHLWHIDVKKHDNEYVGLFTFIENLAGGDTRLHVYKSFDGNNWFYDDSVEFGKKTNVKNLYKATSYQNQDGSIDYLISAIDSHMRWKIYCVKRNNC